MKRSRQILSIVVIFFWASEYAHVPYFTPYLRELGFAASVIGLLTGVYGFTQMLVRIPLGMFTDYTGSYRNVVIMGTVFTTVSSFGLIFAKTAFFILFCRFLAGVAASTWLAFSILYSAYFEPGEDVTAMTNINVFNSAGKLIAFGAGTIVATFWGYRYPLVVSFVVGVIAIAFALQLKEIPINKKPARISDLLDCFRNPHILIPAFFAIVVQFILQGTTFSFTSAVAVSLGATSFQIGMSTALFTIVQVFCGTMIRKKIVERLSDTLAIMGGFLCLGLHCLLVAFAPNMWVIFAAQILAGIGNIMLMSLLMAITVRTIPMEKKSTAMGLFQALYGLGMTAGPVLIGRIFENCNYSFGYGLYAAICFGTMCAAYILVPRISTSNN